MLRPEGTYPGLTTILVLGLMLYVIGYFAHRWWVYRRETSLALVFLCPGWLIAAAILNGDVAEPLFDFFRWWAVISTAFMVYAIIRVEHREAYRRNRVLDEEEIQRRRKKEEPK